jgi:hypothetical protein
MNTFQVGDRVQVNTAVMGDDQAAAHNRVYPGGRRGTVTKLEIEGFTPRYPYYVEFADGWGWFGDVDLLPATVPEAQASLFGEVV